MQTLSRCRRWWILGGMGVVLQAAGCAAPGESSAGRAAGRAGDSASRYIPSTTVDAVRPVAVRVFRQDFRLDPDVSSGNVLVSRPVELTDRPSPKRVREVFGSPNRRRQIATLWLSQDGPHILLRCQVRIQRLDTVERAAFARERGDDRPTDTPIDRLGATSPNAREEWVPVGRDRKTESRILDAIVQRFATPQPAQ